MVSKTTGFRELTYTANIREIKQRAFIFYYVFYTKSQKYTPQVKTMQFSLCILHYVFYTLKNHVLFPGKSAQRILH